MNELMLERMESTNEAIEQEAADCPKGLRAQRAVLEAGEELVFPQHKRLVTQYSTDESGVSELHLYYGKKEILFDEPELFAFGGGWPSNRASLPELRQAGVRGMTGRVCGSYLSSSSRKEFCGGRMTPSPRRN